MVTNIPQDIQSFKNKPKKRKRRGVYITLVLTLIVLAGIGYGAYKLYSFTHSVFKSNGIGSDIASLLPVKASTYSSDIDKALKTGKTVNILLLGYGGAGHDGAYLTDSIMDVSINPTQKNIALISIPRDMWVNIPTSTSYTTQGKVNSAYAIGVDTVNYQDRADKYKGTYGGGNMAKDVISPIIGQPIDYYVSVDFDAFKTIIDDLGGIDINVDHPFDDYEYPSGDNTTDGPLCSAPMNTPTTCRYWHVHFSPGMQHMDGQTALEYARSRHALGAEGSDFARAQRQQEVIVAVKNKAMQINALPQVFSIMNALQGNVQTDLTIGDIKDLATVVKSWDLSNMIHFALTDANYLTATYSSDGQYILIPNAGQDNYTQINQAIQKLWALPEIQNEMKTAKVGIENATGTISIFSQATSALNNDGISIQDLGSVSVQTTVIYDYSNGKYPGIIQDIKTEIGGTVITQNLPANTTGKSIVVIVGTNYSPNTVN